jgi:hypothetical protein
MATAYQTTGSQSRTGRWHSGHRFFIFLSSIFLSKTDRGVLC